jgi:small-conductance mechanosensitive channel
MRLQPWCVDQILELLHGQQVEGQTEVWQNAALPSGVVSIRCAQMLPPEFAMTRSMMLLTGSIPVIYVLMVALGRYLKRQQKVQLGLAYRLFSVVFSVWLPLSIYGEMRTLSPDFAIALKQLDAAGIVFGVLVAIALIRRFFWEVWFERKYNERAPKFLHDLASLLLFGGSIVLAVSVEKGQMVTGITIGSTVLAAVLGLALQDLLGNLIAGIALEIGKPFKTGDWLVVDARHMEVMEVNWRSTRLRTNDDVYFDIPNKTIAGSTIINLTYPTRQHAIRVHVGFDYDAAPNFVKDRLVQATLGVRGVLQTPVPKVFLKNFADSAIEYEVKFWVEDESKLNDILDGVHTNIWYEARRSEIKIPFPTRTIQIERQRSPSDRAMEIGKACLRKQPLLQLLDAPQQEKLLQNARRLHFGRGEKIIKQGAQGQSMFILLEGEADVWVETNGHDTRVATLHRGATLGEMSLLTGEPRSATVIAKTDCEIWEIGKPVLGEMLHENKQLVQQLCDLLTKRRLQNEDAIATSADSEQLEKKEQEYKEGFLERLSSFFEL